MNNVKEEKAMIYLDNAATTRMSAEVFDAMKPYFCEQYANPSAIYSFAGSAAKAVDEARKRRRCLLEHGRKKFILLLGAVSLTTGQSGLRQSLARQKESTLSLLR